MYESHELFLSYFCCVFVSFWSMKASVRILCLVIYVIRHKSHFTGRLWSSWQTIRKVRYINGSVFHLLSTRIFLVRCTDVFGLVCLCFRERVCLLLFSSVWELLNWWMESCRWVENEAVSCRWSAWNAIMPGIGNLPPNILKVTLIRDIQLL